MNYTNQTDEGHVVSIGDIRIQISNKETVTLYTGSSLSLYNQARAFGCSEVEAIEYLGQFLQEIPALSTLYNPATAQFSTFLRNQLRGFLLQQTRTECPGTDCDMMRIANSLPHPFDEIIKLTYYENLSTERLASFMQIPLQAAERVKKQAYRLTSYAIVAIKNKMDIDDYYFSLLQDREQKQHSHAYYRVRYDYNLREIKHHSEELDIPIKKTFSVFYNIASSCDQKNQVFIRLREIFNSQM